MSKQIPIQNIYYLLCYAWDRLDEGDLVSAASEECETLQDLFAKVLVSGTKRLMKRGFNRDYCEREEEMASLRGRIAFTPSIQKLSWLKGRMVCEYTELNYDTVPNRILKTTLRNLLHTKGGDEKIKDEIASVLHSLHEVSSVRLSGQIFRRIEYHQNLRFYRFLMNVCELVFDSLIPNQNDSDSVFRDFIRDERKMAYVFENFVLNFYQRETNLSVKSSNFPWQGFEGNESAKNLLPTMKTDVELRIGNKLTILDCKYYREAFSENYNIERFKTSNLYQLYAYLMNRSLKDPHLEISGMLLYPEVSKSFRYDFKLQGFPITVASINLAQPWMKIAQELKALVH